jgi:hypothetical protein
MQETVTPATAPAVSALTRPTLIRCLTTGELVPTGVYVTDLSHLEPANVLPFCPACGADHEWVPSEAMFTAM